jgi:ribosomal-protein-serine acetyltransferase
MKGETIRPFSREDVSELFALVQQNEAYLKPWVSWLAQPYTRDAAVKFIEASLQSQRAMQFGIWTQKGLVGVVGVHGIDSANQSTAIGHWLSAEAQGYGTMTQACAELVAHLFGKHLLHRVEVRCAVHNRRSNSIPRRLSFTHEGIRREAEYLEVSFHDQNVYSVLSYEWPVMRRYPG